MSAFDDIERTLKVLPRPRREDQRVVAVGISAERAITSTIVQGNAPDNALEQILGVPVRLLGSGDACQGWGVFDCRPDGTFVEVNPAPITKFSA